MARRVASLFGVLGLDDSDFRQGMQNARGEMTGLGSQLQNIGGQMQSFGGQMTAVFAPVGVAMGVAVNNTRTFDRTMSNVFSITQQTGDEAAQLRAQLLAIGSGTVAGPQAIAESYYEIVSGVADASTHMAILNNAIAMSEAGQADLGASTSALISTMNSYGFSADQATFVSDVFSRTVGMGVLSMDELASAMPQVTGLAAQFNQPLEAMGGSLAFMTTQGFSASQSATFLRSMISTLLNPTADLSEAITELGYSSGEALLEGEGLVGAYQMLSAQNGGLAGLITNQEALTGSLIMTGDAADDFLTTYNEGITGATGAAGAIQDQTESWDKFNSALAGVGILMGSTVMPLLTDLLTGYINPLILGVGEWITQNPQLAQTIMLVGGALVGLGPVIAVVGTVISGLGIVMGALTSPILLVVGALAGLWLAFETNFMGIRDLIQPFVDSITGGFTNIDVSFMGIVNSIGGFLMPALQNLIGVMVGIWEAVSPALSQLGNWFIADVIPQVVNIITNSVMPALQTFGMWLNELWNLTQPQLQALADYFLTGALPTMMGFISGTVLPTIQTLIDGLMGVWLDVQPYLTSLFDWFVTGALPGVVGYVTNNFLPIIQSIVDLLGSIWNLVSPALGSFYDWFMTSGLPVIKDFIEGPFIGAINNVTGVVSGLLGGINNVISGAGDMINGIGVSLGITAPAGARAAGGPVDSGKSYLVGEQGPELFVPRMSGGIVPNHALAGAGGGSSGDTFNVTIHAGAGADGRAIARDFNDEMQSIRRRRG